jgi:hypothetical protein
VVAGDALGKRAHLRAHRFAFENLDPAFEAGRRRLARPARSNGGRVAQSATTDNGDAAD